MDACIAEIDRRIRSLTPKERDRIGIGGDLSRVLDFEVLDEELSINQCMKWLVGLGLSVNQQKFKELASQFESAEGLSHYLTDSGMIDIDPYSREAENLFHVLTDLWEHWIPERPSMEKLEDYIRLGEAFLEKEQHFECCMAWLSLFPRVWEIVAKLDCEGTKDPFDAFQMTFYNWIQDLQFELQEAGSLNLFFHEQRIIVAEAYLQHCPDFDSGIAEGMRSAIGETYFHLGKTDEADGLFKKWLEEDPTWGWGWIHWSDCYSFYESDKSLDYTKAKNILQNALLYKKVREKDIILDRLAYIAEKEDSKM